MLGIIILLKTMATREALPDEGHKPNIQNICVSSSSKVPVKIMTGVGPLGEIPAHTFTFAGCFGCCLSGAGCPTLRYDLARKLSIWMVHSSLHITSSKSSPHSSLSLHHFSLFFLYCSRMREHNSVFFYRSIPMSALPFLQ